MTCREFERWLDDGMPGMAGDRPGEHARDCPECARRLAAAVEIDAALARPAAFAPSGFAGGVMDRIGRLPGRVPVSTLIPDALPWWTKAGAEPATALALILAALLIGRLETVWRAAATAGGAATLGAAWIEGRMDAWGAALGPLGLTGLWLAVAPPLLLLGVALYRLTEASALRLARGRAPDRS